MEQSSEPKLSSQALLRSSGKFSDRIAACLSQRTDVSQLLATFCTAKDENLRPSLGVALLLMYQQQFQWRKKLSSSDTWEGYRNTLKPKELIGCRKRLPIEVKNIFLSAAYLPVLQKSNVIPLLIHIPKEKWRNT